MPFSQGSFDVQRICQRKQGVVGAGYAQLLVEYSHNLFTSGGSFPTKCELQDDIDCRILLIGMTVVSLASSVRVRKLTIA